MKLKLLFNIILAIVSSLPAAAASLTEEADSAYMHDDYAEATRLYLQIANEEGTSSNLYYNLGNCYYRQKQLGRAILYYERALRLDPGNSDARANLEFVNSKITDEPGDRGMFISNTVNGFAQKTGANIWAGIAIASFILLLGSIAVYVFMSNVRMRKLGFFGAFALLAICVLANIFASIATRYSTSSTIAVVVEPSTLLSTSPRAPKDRSEEAVLLHEGTTVEILDSVTTRTDSTAVKWYDVKVDNSTRAWIRGSDIERI